MKKLFGVVCATITPMNEDGNINESSLRSLFRYLLRQGIHGLYPNGTNGESLLLNDDERKLIAGIAVEEAAGRASVYIQCGASTAEETRRHIVHATQIGADGTGVMTPTFFPCDDHSMLLYYDTMLAVSPEMPAYVYSIPTQTGNGLTVSVLSKLMEKHKNLQGIKFSSPDLLMLQKYLNEPVHKPDVLIGCDRLVLCCMMSGGTGWVSGPAAVFSRRFVELYDAITRGDINEARVLQNEVWKTSMRMEGIPEIPAIKYMLKKLGVIESDTVRPPLRSLNGPERGVLDAILSEYAGI